MKENILYLKLVTGEDILAKCLKTDKSKDTVKINSPLQIHTTNMSMGAGVRLAKWIPHSKQMEYVIHIDDIIVMTKPIESLIEYYYEALDVLKDKTLKTVTQKDKEQYLKDSLEYLEFISNTDITVH